MDSTNSSRRAAITLNSRSSEAVSGEPNYYRSIFRCYVATNAIERSHRSFREAAPTTLLALEVYIYLSTYTQLNHDDVCVIIFIIMPKVDWEMLALLDESRDLRVPNIYDAEDNVEEEDLWAQIRGLPDDHITSSFNSLVHRLGAAGFSVVGVLRPQMGRQTWSVVWDGRGLPVEKQPALVHSRFNIDPAAVVVGFQSSRYPATWTPPAPRLVGFVDEIIRNAPQRFNSMDYDRDVGDGVNDQGNYFAENEIDDELARVMELSRKEF